MWVQRAAIRPVPAWARVPSAVLERVEGTLGSDDDEDDDGLEKAFQKFEEGQPALSARVANLLGQPMNETALALGYFLTLSVFLAFQETFADRLSRIDEAELDAVAEELAFDEEMRKGTPDEAMETDDIVAMQQPDIVRFVREHIEVALEDVADKAVIDEVDRIYRMVLLETVALSHAVAAPDLPTGKAAYWA